MSSRRSGDRICPLNGFGLAGRGIAKPCGGTPKFRSRSRSPIWRHSKAILRTGTKACAITGMLELVPASLLSIPAAVLRLAAGLIAAIRPRRYHQQRTGSGGSASLPKPGDQQKNAARSTPRRSPFRQWRLLIAEIAAPCHIYLRGGLHPHPCGDGQPFAMVGGRLGAAFTTVVAVGSRAPYPKPSASVTRRVSAFFAPFAVLRRECDLDRA